MAYIMYPIVMYPIVTYPIVMPLAKFVQDAAVAFLQFDYAVIHYIFGLETPCIYILYFYFPSRSVLVTRPC